MSTVSDAVAKDSKGTMPSTSHYDELGFAMLALNLDDTSDPDTDSEFGDDKEADKDEKTPQAPPRVQCMLSLPTLEVIFHGWPEEKLRKYLSDWPEDRLVKLISQTRRDSKI